jgi:hypothetical protein
MSLRIPQKCLEAFAHWFGLSGARPRFTSLMDPLICWSFSSSMFRYRFVDHAVPAMCRSLAACEVQGGLTIRECAHYTRAPSDLALNALERFVIRHVYIDTIIRILGCESGQPFRKRCLSPILQRAA